MKNFFALLSRGLILLFIFSACETADEPLETNETSNELKTVKKSLPLNKLQETGLPEHFAVQLSKFEKPLINTYTVEFLGRTVTGTNDNITTTFSYRVTGNGATPQLDSFLLETPNCSGSIVDYSPTQSANVSEGAIKWNNSVSKDGSQEYSVTYAGNIPLGIISSTVTRGSVTETQDIVGPCNGVYILSGNIFIDLNGDGNKQLSESGISGFPIDLIDSDTEEKFGTVFTSSNGSYSFMVLAGNFKITVGEDLLNDDNYTATGDTFYNVSHVQESSSGYNFGFSMDADKVISDLDNKIIPVNTEPTKFWVQQIRNAGKKNGLYSKETIRGFLVDVEGMLLSEPFQLGEDKETKALEILSRPIRTDLDAFLQQLLTAELNIASGRGALISSQSTELNTGFNSALLSYSEAVACREMGSCPQETVTTSSREAETKAVSSRDTQMLSSFNGSGGV